jgi:two-component system, chemotaxis family, CheB/CheR fusion protein
MDRGFDSPPLDDSNVTPRSAGPLYVVGIGASAGGLDALERFFDNVQPDSDMAYVVVQHLSPDFKSLMDEILARRTRLPIHLVENGMRVEPNHLYLIPPKMDMIIQGGLLLLSEKGRDQELSLPIDVFFRSLAQDCRERAVAIVLSGGGTDGSRGVKAVHDAGGLVVVQNEETAQFDGMPRTARDAGVADLVLPPEEMPHALVDYARGNVAPSGTPGGLKHGMAAVYQMLEREFGIDFTHYKASTVTRRIERRLQLARAGDLDAYVERLRDQRQELDILYRDLLIGVTHFFRNEEAFRVIEQKVLPDLFERDRQAPLRVWVAGCATGEEVYSLAILLHELAPKYGNRPVKIFATDVHPGSLELATRATYDEEAVAQVSPARLERYFLRRGSSYQVVPDLRQMVVFAPHNVIRDAPFTRVDLISCRNLLIYLQPPAQQKVLNFFHFALKRGGMVVLGPSESPGALLREYETVDKQWRVYRKYSDSRMKVETRSPSVGRREPSTPFAPLVQGPRYSVAHLLTTYDALLEDRMPPSLLITDKGELVHSFGGASEHLRLHDGRQALDVRELCDGDLRMALVGGIPRSLKDPTTLRFSGVRLQSNGEPVQRDVSIRAVRGRGAPTPHVLISFEAAETPKAAPTPERRIDLGDVSRDRLDAVEAELTNTKESLQAATEELETSNEELQAANEELLASNEELQSTNEELQSVNEELYSVNAEYQRKIADLTELTNDMENLLSSTDIATIFLDRQLKIRKFTTSIASTFDLLPQDVGRSIETFTSTIEHPELLNDLRNVAANGKPIERELRDGKGRAFFMRVLPYRAKGTIDGVVLTLIDVSGLKAAEDALFHERHLLNSLLDTVPDAIYFKDARGRFIRANRPMLARLSVGEAKDVVGRTAFELPASDRALDEHRHDDTVIRTGTSEHYSLEERTKNGVATWDLVTRLPIKDAIGATVGMIGIVRDVTTEKRAEQKIQEAVRRRDHFLAMLSHELRNPLGAMVTATTLMKQRSADGEDKLLAVLDRQSRQMGRLLDDLLEASRVTQNKIELKKTVTALGPIARDAADSMRTMIAERGIALDVRIPSEAIMVVGDVTRLLQIHVNLLNNAAKYTPRGGHVTLGLGREGSDAVIRVEDDGVGIGPEMLEGVFDLFVQSRRTLDRADGGLGVGLTLVRSLVELHGGKVVAQSDGEGSGATFVVRLPAVDEAEASTELRPRSLAQLPRAAKIVIIEDNVDSREVLAELLAHAGFECHLAGDGVEGLALLEAIRPHVAIIDLGLPLIDGFELAKRMRQKDGQVQPYLVALTGYGQKSDRLAALDAGFDEHLVKPIDSAVLMQLLGHSSSPGDMVPS